MNAVPPDLCIAALSTTWGTISIVAGERGVWSCELPERVRAGVSTFAVRSIRCPENAPDMLRASVAHARAALEGGEAGERPEIHPDVFCRASPFRRAVWRALMEIPRGQTLTYGEVAKRVGLSGAARAAGGACGANPVPLFVPCHRVVAGGGRLGGFSCGVEWKTHLLAMEEARR